MALVVLLAASLLAVWCAGETHYRRYKRAAAAAARARTSRRRWSSLLDRKPDEGREAGGAQSYTEFRERRDR
jgi:hypothetical protein